MTAQNLLKELFVADPDLAAQVTERLLPEDVPVLSSCLKNFIEDAIWGLTQEYSFGKSIAWGYMDLIQGKCHVEQLVSYHRYIRKFGQSGPALGKILAEHLVPIMQLKDEVLFEKFLITLDAMLEKGAYTLYGPFKVLSDVCRTRDKSAVSAYLGLLKDTFSLPLTYKQCRPFTYTLPKAVSSFSAGKRAFQMQQLTRVIKADFRLSDKFLEGLSKGLWLLTESALDEFVSMGLEKLSKNLNRCAKFLSLEAKSGLDAFSDMQVTVPLSQVRPAISRYINARTGFPVALKPLSSVPGSLLKGLDEKPEVISDGKCIYLPDEISLYDEKQKNADFYKIMAKLEVGLFEFGTFDFDIEKLRRRFDLPFDLFKSEDNLMSDLEKFITGFDDSQLASDLFTVFEHGRIKLHLAKNYPGLLRCTSPMLQHEFTGNETTGKPIDLMGLLYGELVLGLLSDRPSITSSNLDEASRRVFEKAVFSFNAEMSVDAGVETSAQLVLEIYPEVNALAQGVLPLKTPFGRKIEPEIYFSALRQMDRLAFLLKKKLAEEGIEVYRSEVKKRLVENDGSLSLSDLKALALSFNQHASQAKLDGMKIDLTALLKKSGISPLSKEAVTGPAFYYKEWDNLLGDYLHHHTLVRVRELPESQSDFYDNTMARHNGLIKQIRYAFELLKPEGLTILRQWVEGDEFDYRALLDFAIDKRAGLMPSDRLYIKRIKRQRDVAVLLLVDLSRSTANTVFDSTASVLDVEKEAIVLFCEALEVVGDAYAIAGFSGTGRLGVDYFSIKGFDDILTKSVRRRINAMNPQRSTRMGAAIRHATAQLDAVSSKVKLLIVIGDGFPNDVDYKKDYAIDDTRKAIAEARSKNIHTHALTVNISADPKLDDLYGNVHHHVISDVRELPDKLPRIYSTLTRY